MKRRELLRSLAAVPLLAGAAFGARRNAVKPARTIKPKRLAKGDTVALISPSSGIDAAGFEKALQNMADLGLKVKAGKNSRAQNGFLAGTDKERLDDLHEAFADQEVKAIWCIRGGYGATRFLPQLDLKLIKKNPKIFIGYSDITALHLAIYQNTGLVTFHAPTAAATFTDYVKANISNVLMQPLSPLQVNIATANAANESNLFKTEVITPGKCRGEIIGGNLSLIAAMTGTPYAIKDVKGKILFIEDVGEAPYRIDRMLTQLRQSSRLRECAGIALGIFEGCNPKDGNSQSLINVMKDRLGDLGVPVIYGLSFGHIREQMMIPLGIKAELDTETATLTFLENAVS